MYKGYERAFCVRMKSTLTKRGCHFKSSGYRVRGHYFETSDVRVRDDRIRVSNIQNLHNRPALLAFTFRMQSQRNAAPRQTYLFRLVCFNAASFCHSILIWTLADRRNLCAIMIDRPGKEWIRCFIAVMTSSVDCILRLQQRINSPETPFRSSLLEWRRRCNGRACFGAVGRLMCRRLVSGARFRLRFHLR